MQIATSKNRQNAISKGECIDDRILETGHESPQNIIAMSNNIKNIFCTLTL